jgi:hypothetical protein
LKRSRKLLSVGLSLMREFKTVECKSRKYDVVCVKEGCSWRVHAYKGLLGMLNCHSAHLSFAGGAEDPSQPYIAIHRKLDVQDDSREHVI